MANIDEKVFVEALRSQGRLRGLAVAYPGCVKKSDCSKVEEEFVALYQKLAQTKKPDMIAVVVLTKDSNVYSTVKTLGVVSHGIPTEVILKKNASIGPKSSLTIHNICLKLNAKLGGVNQIIHRDHRPEVLLKHTV